MANKSSSLNLWNVEDKSSKLDIDVKTTHVEFTTTGTDQYLKFTPRLHLVDSTNGDVENVSQKLYTLEAAIASGAAGSAAATSLVQSNLTAYESANNQALATLNATVVSNKATSDANHTSDSQSRLCLKTDLETKIQGEEDARVADVATLTASLSTETTNRTTADQDEATARANADTTLQNNINIQTARIDAILAGSNVNLDTFLEVVNAYESADTNLLATVTQLQADLTTLTARIDELTNS